MDLLINLRGGALTIRNLCVAHPFYSPFPLRPIVCALHYLSTTALGNSYKISGADGRISLFTLRELKEFYEKEVLSSLRVIK